MYFITSAMNKMQADLQLLGSDCEKTPAEDLLVLW